MKISVLICAYNAERFIKQAVESVFNQNRFLGTVEVVAIDDGSTDKTAEILKRHGNKIKYFYQNNKGHAAALNNGLSKVTGDLVCLLDADDFWHEKKLAVVSKIFWEDRNIDVLYHDYSWTDQEGRVTTPVRAYDRGPSSREWNNNYRQYFFQGRNQPFVPTGGMAVRRRVFEKIGSIPEDCATPDIYLRFFLPFYASKIRIISDTLHYYRIHQNNTWNKSVSLSENALRYQRVFEILLRDLDNHARKTHSDVAKLKLMLEKEIRQRQIILEKMNNRYWKAVHGALAIKLDGFGEFEENYWYGKYYRLNLLVKSVFPEKLYHKVHDCYRISGARKRALDFLKVKHD